MTKYKVRLPPVEVSAPESLQRFGIRLKFAKSTQGDPVAVDLSLQQAREMVARINWQLAHMDPDVPAWPLDEGE